MIDDSADFSELVGYSVAASGLRLVHAANGPEALDYLRAHPPPALILLDLRMPGMSGQQFRALQLQDVGLRDIPILLLSAEPDLGDIAVRLGAAGSFRKGGPQTALRDAILRCCRPPPRQ